MRWHLAAAVLGSFFACAALVPACSSGSSAPSGAASASAGKPGAPPPPAAPAAPAEVAPTAIAAASASAAQFREDDFSETDRSRDPFRSFAKVFAEESKGKVASQRDVVLKDYAIDELKLVAIVLRSDPPRAMLVDPNRVGWVVVRGQFVGRSEVVHAGGPGGVDYELNWRVDRIRDGDLVLVRDDPAHSDVPQVTRVIPLHTEAEQRVFMPTMAP
jgi:type IV pilus assembly protein PilP